MLITLQNTMIEIERQNKLLDKAVPYNVVDDETAANTPQQQTLDRRQTIGVTQMIVRFSKALFPFQLHSLFAAKSRVTVALHRGAKRRLLRGSGCD